MDDKDQQIAALREEVARLRQLLARAYPTQGVQRPIDWGEGPDPGRNSSGTLPLVQQAQFFNVAKDFTIDMGHLNTSSSSFVQHLAEIRPSLRNIMQDLLQTMESYHIYINYCCEMSRLANVCFTFYVVDDSLFFRWMSLMGFLTDEEYILALIVMMDVWNG